MSKRTVYTIITPLPPGLSRETVLAALHDHALMIELNPLVLSHRHIKPPRFAPADEYYSPWYEITDKVQYLPGGVLSGKVVYHAVCHDLPWGLQTHCYAPMGVDIKGKWLLKGTLPGEPREPVELGVKVPSEGLYIREDIDMKVNFMMNKLVKKQLQEAHGTLLDRLLVGANLIEDEFQTSRPSSMANSSSTGTPASSYARPVSSLHSYTVELPGKEHQEPVELPAGPVVFAQAAPRPPSPPRYDSYNPYGVPQNSNAPPPMPSSDATRLLTDSRTSPGISTSSPPNVAAHPHTADHRPASDALDRSTSVTSSYSTYSSNSTNSTNSYRSPSSYDQYQHSQPQPSPGIQYAQPMRSPSFQYRHPDAPLPPPPPSSTTVQYAQTQPAMQYAQPLRSPELMYQQPQPASPGLPPGASQSKDTVALQRFRQSLQRQRTMSG